jgi:cytidylate kinase
VTSDRVRLVTISAAYGAGGSVIAPALAQRLGVPFMQRATTTAGGVADNCTEQLTPDEEQNMPVNRLLASFTHAASFGSTQSPLPASLYDEELRRGGEEGILALAAAGGGVVLGRGAAVVLGRERGFHVRLYGPAELRAAQGAGIEGIGPDEARKHLTAADRARDAYVRRLYHVDPADPKHYHLMIDSTALPLDVVTELVFRAVTACPAAVPAPRAVAG